MEKLHAAVARSTFQSQNVKKLTGSDHFLKLRCGKMACRCSEKYIFQSKMYKTPHGRTTFGSCDVEKLHAAVARSRFQSQNVKKLTGSDHFLKLRCGKIARRCSEKDILSQNRKKLTVSEHFLKFRCGKIARRCSEKDILKSKS